MKGEVKIVGVIKAERRAGFFLRCDCEENKRLPEPGNTCSSQTGAKLESWRLGMEKEEFKRAARQTHESAGRCMHVDLPTHVCAVQTRS